MVMETNRLAPAAGADKTMKSLFPEFEKDIAESKLAERRERQQQARHWLSSHEGHRKWIISTLEKEGPQLDANLFFKIADLRDCVGLDIFKEAMEMFLACEALWLIGELWREPFPDHPSGEPVLRYGIIGKHRKPEPTQKEASPPPERRRDEN